MGRAAAALLLLAGVGAVVWVVSSRSLGRLPRTQASPVFLVQDVSARRGLANDRIRGERVDDHQAEPWWDVRVHVPPEFEIRELLLDLQAAAHNQGGRLEPAPVTDGRGAGLAALSGRLAEQRVRITVVKDEPRRRSTPPPRGDSPRRARLAVVLDDAGYSPNDAETLAPLPRQVAVAVLPNAPFARMVAQALVAQGREVLVHLPMEPLPGEGADPGEGAIMVGLEAEEVRHRLTTARSAVPGAVGVNNHMGSRATADESCMTAVMNALAGQGLYFLDSRTTTASVAFSAARRAGIPALQRDVFLDAVPQAPAIRRALREAVELARHQGEAVAIGHVHGATPAVLIEDRDWLLAQLELVVPSRLAR